MKKLIVLDMDGTLLNDKKVILPQSVKILFKLQKQGIKLALASGRTINNLKRYADLLELTMYKGYLIGNNGQELLRLSDGIYQKKEGIHEDVWRRILTITRSYHLKMGIRTKDFHVLFDGRTNTYRKKIADCDIVEDSFLYMGNADKVTLSVPFPYDSFDELKQQLLEKTEHKVNVYRTDRNRVEISPYYINKAMAVKEILQLEKLCGNEVLCFGDSENDYELAEEFQLIAMGNAMQEVKEKAWKVIGDHNEDSIARELKVMFSL